MWTGFQSGPEARPLVDLIQIPAVWLRILALLATTAFGSAVVVHALTFGPLNWAEWLQGMALGLVPATIPLFGSMVVIMALTRPRYDRLLSSVPAAVQVVAAIAVVYVGVNFFLMVSELPGVPVEQGGHFFYNNHGRLTTIDDITYRQGLMHVARLFSGVELAFTGGAAILAHQLHWLRTLPSS